MPIDVEAAVKALNRMTVTQLRQRYAEVFGEAARSFNKQHLVKRIAWRLQAIHEGDLSERLWRDLGLPEILKKLRKGRRFEFPVERAVFLTVLHRLFSPGSDRAAEAWRTGYAISGSETLELHHLYRTPAPAKAGDGLAGRAVAA
jgi:hypothetical protein